MPHAGHLIVGNDCRFHLNTRVGKYIVSTVGEYWPDQAVRRIHAEIHDKKWYQANLHLKGDYFDAAYHKKFGFTELGMSRTYETMVFRAVKEKTADAKYKCCPWKMTSGELDMEGYNTATDAYAGHMKLCKKWSKK